MGSGEFGRGEGGGEQGGGGGWVSERVQAAGAEGGTFQ